MYYLIVDKKTIKNRTVFSKSFYHKVAVFNMLHTEKVGSLVSFIVLVFIFIYSLFFKVDLSEKTKIIMIICFTFFPILFFGIPYFLTIRKYRFAISQSKDNSYFIDTEIDKTNIRCKNNIGKVAVFQYYQITSLIESKDLIAIKTSKSKQPLYLNKNGFVNCDSSEVIDFLEEKIKLN